METFKDLPVILIADQPSWRDWLTQNHQNSQGVWLKLAKKASQKVSVSNAQAIDEALCFGWIDGQKQSYTDDDYWLQKFSPRRPKSTWSKINVAKVEALTSQGKMQPAGLAAVELAKQDGRWDAAYDSASTSTVPQDFQDALNQNPQAKQFFNTLNKTNTYAFCWRIQTAKRLETRKARIEKFIAMLNNGEKLY